MADYINGSDVLFDLEDGSFGHATSHTLNLTSEVKSRAVKPPKSEPADSGLWDEKTVVKKNITLSVEGLRHKGESEKGYKTLAASWHKGQPVKVSAYERGGDAEPYFVGRMVITSVTETSPAGDDATYSAELELTGAPEKFEPGKLAGESIEEDAKS